MSATAKITIFTCPKPFRGQSLIAQRNAIETWLRLIPRPDIFLMGNDEGVSQAAEELGVGHLPEVMCNEYGTPLVSSLFAEAEKHSVSPYLCFVNADIILLKDFMDGVQIGLRERPGALMAGRRWNLDIPDPIQFDGDWEHRLIKRIRREGKLYPFFAIDYFVFPRGSLGQLPAFAIGRPAWDNWVIYRACSSDMGVLDMTRTVTVIHQNHDYSHHPGGWQGAMKGEESKQNILIAGEVAHVHSLLDAKYRLTPEGVKSRRFPPFYVPFYLYRSLTILSHTHPWLRPMVNIIRTTAQGLAGHP